MLTSEKKVNGTKLTYNAEKEKLNSSSRNFNVLMLNRHKFLKHKIKKHTEDNIIRDL